MKKILKLFLVILLVTVVALAVTGCGKKNEENKANTATIENNTKEGSKESTTESGSSKTVNALSKLQGDYVMSLEEESESETMAITIAVKGANIYADVKSDDEHATIIYKDGTTYLIEHSEKVYMTQEGKAEDTLSDMTFITKEDLEEIKKQECKTGKETIVGTEYDYEQYTDSEENTVETFYFSGNDLRYMKFVDGDESEELVKVNTLSSDVDDSLFEIPTDYEKVEIEI